MEAKFKIGDKVLLNNPKDKHDGALTWQTDMECYIGDILEVIGLDTDIKTYYCEGEDFGCWVNESWLTKVGEGIIEEESRIEELNPIDWEKRRWDLYKMFIMHYSQYSIGEALNAADRCIEIYKQTLK